MLTTIRLNGVLGREFGRCFVLDINYPAQAISALCNMVPGFKARVIALKNHVFRVRRGRKDIGADEMRFEHFGRSISITPMTKMAASAKGIISAILGVVLIVVGIVFSEFGGSSLIGPGLALLASGIASLLAPHPSSNANADKSKTSYQFSGAVNVMQQGGPVPLVYGEVIVGSNVVSAGVDARDYTDPNAPTSGTGTSNGGGFSPGVPIKVYIH